MLFIVDFSLICMLMLFALVTVISAAQFFHGLAAVIITVLFAAEAVAGIYFTVKKSEHRRIYKARSVADVLLTAASSLLCLFTSYLFLRDVGLSFSTYISSVPIFISAVLFICCPCLCSIAFWIMASGYEDVVNYFEFVKQLVASVILFVALLIM